MKEVTLYEVKETKILVEDARQVIQTCYCQQLDRIIGGIGEVAVDIGYRVTDSKIMHLSRIVNYEDVLKSNYTVQPIYKDRYYALTPEAEDLMTITGLYDGNQHLRRELGNKEVELSAIKEKVDMLTSTKFFGRLKMLFTGIK